MLQWNEMIPLYDDIPARRHAYVMHALIAINVLAFLYEIQALAADRYFLMRHGLVPALFLSPAVPIAWKLSSLLTHMFLHGGFFHLFGNMWTLYIFGDNVEDRMGPLTFLLFYLSCGAAAAMAQVMSAPHSNLPTIGASGAIAGVMGAYLVFFPTARLLVAVPVFIVVEFIELPAYVFLVVWFMFQVFYGTAQAAFEGAAVGGIAWWAHAGGFLAGVVWARIILEASEKKTGSGYRVRHHPAWWEEEYRL